MVVARFEVDHDRPTDLFFCQVFIRAEESGVFFRRSAAPGLAGPPCRAQIDGKAGDDGKVPLLFTSLIGSPKSSSLARSRPKPPSSSTEQFTRLEVRSSSSIEGDFLTLV